MEIIEHKIGETFCLEDGTKLQVVKSTCNCKDTKGYFQYILTKRGSCTIYSHPLFHKGLYINKTFEYYPETFIVTFNSEEAAKKAIDILGDELNVLFE